MTRPAVGELFRDAHWTRAPGIWRLTGVVDPGGWLELEPADGLAVAFGVDYDMPVINRVSRDLTPTSQTRLARRPRKETGT